MIYEILAQISGIRHFVLFKQILVPNIHYYFVDPNQHTKYLNMLCNAIGLANSAFLPKVNNQEFPYVGKFVNHTLTVLVL